MKDITRRELIFRKLPKIALFVGGLGIVCSPVLRPVLAEPISTKKSASDKKDSVRSDNFVKQLLYQTPNSAFIDATYVRFCRKNRLNPRSAKVINDYKIAKLLYDLVRDEGVLGNKYEAKECRERNIRRVQDGKLLPLGDSVKGRYPAKMMRDMFSEKPGYVSFPDKKFHCFGDNDEFEMVYVTLLRYMGMKAKVVMTASNHVETLVRIGGKEFLVDNSFSNFGHKRRCEGRCRDWMTGRIGHTDWKRAKAYINLVNKKARENATVMVDQEVFKRILEAVLSYYR